MTFYVGQRVVAISAPDHNDDLIGQSGEVVEVVPGTGLTVCVLFDEYSEDYEWWCEPTSLSPIFIGPPPPIHMIVEEKCKQLWNKSKFVLSNPHLAY